MPMNLRALARASDDSVYTLSLLGFSSSSSSSFSLFFFLFPRVCFLYLSLTFKLRERCATRDRPNVDAMRRWYKKDCIGYMNSIHDYRLHPEPPLGKARWRFVFFCISLFSSWKYFLPAEFYAGCGGNVAEVSRWSFFGDDDLIITFIVFSVWYHGAGCAWCGDYKSKVIKITLSRGTDIATLLHER